MSDAASIAAFDWPTEIQRLARRIAPRGKSLIMTVYGDAILPRGGGAWLGDLIALLEPLGLNERVIRTSVYRLVQDDLLSSTQVGRRSFYALTENGSRQTSEAAKRIYARRAGRFDGVWTQVWLQGPEADTGRALLIQELGRQGFAALTADILLHHGDATETAASTAARLDRLSDVIILRVGPGGSTTPVTPSPRWLAQIWPLDALAAEYREFLELLANPLAGLENGPAPDPMSCFLLRSLAVHAYRRIVLKDPMLPAALLPADWPGLRAEHAMAMLYDAISEPAQAHVTARMTGVEHPAGSPEPWFRSRFKG